MTVNQIKQKRAAQQIFKKHYACIPGFQGRTDVGEKDNEKTNISKYQ